MQLNYSVVKVNENDEVSKGIYKLSVEGEFNTKPGQFYMIKAWNIEPLLPRPISVHDVHDGKISFLYQVRGLGTENLSRLSKGSTIELLGPLGNGFDTDRFKGRIALVAGGMGIAPMLHIAKSLKGSQIDLYAGFRDDAYGTDEMKRYVENIYIATENGSEGTSGYITEIFNPWEYNLVLCCGPRVMMERVVKMCNESATPVYVSMENHMACGIGACLVCTCKTMNGNKRTCKDGPVFSGKDVMLDA
jgi:dihydroorotate dehydrogenase electron transfer subunit